MINDKLFIIKLIELESNLYQKTNFLAQELLEKDSSEIPMFEFNCAEIKSSLDIFKLFFEYYPEHSNLSFDSMISAYEKLILEISKSVNKRSLASKFDNIEDFHDEISSMLKCEYSSFQNE